VLYRKPNESARNDRKAPDKVHYFAAWQNTSISLAKQKARKLAAATVQNGCPRCGQDKLCNYKDKDEQYANRRLHLLSFKKNSRLATQTHTVNRKQGQPESALKPSVRVCCIASALETYMRRLTIELVDDCPSLIQRANGKFSYRRYRIHDLRDCQMTRHTAKSARLN
jgi:hypothetical protein